MFYSLIIVFSAKRTKIIVLIANDLIIAIYNGFLFIEFNSASYLIELSS